MITRQGFFILYSYTKAKVSICRLRATRFTPVMSGQKTLHFNANILWFGEKT